MIYFEQNLIHKLCGHETVNMSSKSWKSHFELPEEIPKSGTLKVKCKYCQTFIAGNVQTTSNFSSHIKRKHRNEYLSHDKQDEQKNSLTSFVKKNFTKYCLNDSRQKEITDALVHVIDGTLSPLSIVENQEFKRFINLLDQRYQIPSRKQLSIKHLNNVFLDVEASLKQKWKVNDNNFPTLALLAKRFLSIPASSAPVERLFSVAGKCFRPERCRLGDDTFLKLMMIRCNSKVM